MGADADAEAEKLQESPVANGTLEVAEKPRETVADDAAAAAAPAKSPSLTAHRISVTSMDDVSLDEGTLLENSMLGCHVVVVDRTHRHV